MHRTVSIGPYLPGDLVFFTTGLTISLVLLVLTLRAARIPGTPVANILFSICALLWSAGGFARVLVFNGGAEIAGPWMDLAQAIQFFGAAAFPFPILSIWRPYAVSAWQKRAARAAAICSGASALAIGVLLTLAVSGVSPLPFSSIVAVTVYNTAFFLLAGVVISLRRASTPRSVFIPSLALAVAAVVTAIAYSYPTVTFSREWRLLVSFLASHLILAAALCAFFLFARFRYADLFIRYGVRILLAGVWASILGSALRSAQTGGGGAHTMMHVVHLFQVVLIANFLLLSFTFVDDFISRIVNGWLFHAADYQAAGRSLSQKIDSLDTESAIAAAVETTVVEALQADGAKLVRVADGTPVNWPEAFREGEISELAPSDPLRNSLPLRNTELLTPVTSHGRVTHALLVSPGSARPGLVVQDLNFLRRIAAQCGGRLDALRREREASERQSRETALLQQVTEAELRALRAQIHPHFLFNSLNTIADLIIRDPVRAEEMTLRLSSVFRYVLANSSRPLTPVRDEFDFVRTYLAIEEIRFSDRLQVHYSVAPELAGESVPSLILQPLVENALKHGLAQKPGPATLWISADRDGQGQFRLRVEDDGVGPADEVPANGTGVGLQNVAQRLRTLYGEKASVRLEPREGGGSRATVLIPLASSEVTS